MSVFSSIFFTVMEVELTKHIKNMTDKFCALANEKRKELTFEYAINNKTLLFLQVGKEIEKEFLWAKFIIILKVLLHFRLRMVFSISRAPKLSSHKL